MTKCAGCGTLILFGGRRDAGFRYCSDRCLNIGELLKVSHQVPADVVQTNVRLTHEGRCPMCHRLGPVVDVHSSYRVWSAVVLTSWKVRAHVCCRRCGVKRQVEDVIYCFVLGWWGLPGGLLMTPIQIGRNLAAIARRSDPTVPSPELERLIRVMLATEILRRT